MTASARSAGTTGAHARLLAAKYAAPEHGHSMEHCSVCGRLSLNTVFVDAVLVPFCASHMPSVLGGSATAPYLDPSSE